MPRTLAGAISRSLLLALLAAAGCSAPPPAWIAALDYRPEQVHAIRVGWLGMPFARATVGGCTREWLFDTGDMVGLMVSTEVFDELGLPVTGRWRFLDADGRAAGEQRRARAPAVELLGAVMRDVDVHETNMPGLAGLFGPGALPGTRFTLDYRARVLAVADTSVQAPAGCAVLPLVRSRHPRLILAVVHVGQHPVLAEFDTGASRTNVDPALARALGLPTTVDGVRVDALTIGSAVFAVPSAKVVGRADVDPALAPPLQLAIGSDILSQLVLTVDYAAGSMFVDAARGR